MTSSAWGYGSVGQLGDGTSTDRTAPVDVSGFSQAPDLVETAVSNPPASVRQGGSFNATDTAKNVGTGPASLSTTRYYLSLDKTKSASDVLLTGTRAVPALAAGVTSKGTVCVTVPATTPLGTYYLLACADDLKVVKESKEGNNCRASLTTVQIVP